MTKQRRQAAEGDTVLAEGGMTVAITDVRAHHLRREEVAHAALDSVALKGVIVVRRPEAMAALEDFIIDPPAPGGAGFKFNVRETGHQRIQQAVELARLRVRGGASLMPRLHQLAVHIPLHVVHRMLAQQPAHPLQQIIKRFGNVEVQDKLMAASQRGIARQRQHPVRVRPVQIGVRVNHFRLHPNTEFHPQRFHVINNRRQAVGVLFLIKIPVPKRRPVVVAPFKPAVIDNKALDAQRRRLVSHTHDVVRVVVEIDPLPGVEMHRARLVAREANNPFAQITMELLAHAVQPIRRVAGIQVRRPQGFPFRQRHFARQIERLGLQIATAIGFHLRPQAMVTAPGQMHAPDFTLHLAKGAAAGDQGREMFVRGAPAAVLQHKAVVLQRQAVRLKLADPAAMESHHLASAFGDRQRDRQAIHLPWAGAQIGHAMAHTQHAAGIQRDLAVQTQAGLWIFADQGQRLALVPHFAGGEQRRGIQTLTMAFNARRTKQAMAQLCH